jgi:copper(I)-binding protein
MKKTAVALLLAMIPVAALAQVSVKDAWIRATVPQGTATGAFMQLVSARDARLVAVRSAVAGVTEVHQMAMSGQTMTMHPVDGIDLPAGQPVDLASGGYHIMLMELKHQLKAGETVPLTLVIRNKGSKKTEDVVVQVPVKPLAYVAPAAKP